MKPSDRGPVVRLVQEAARQTTLAGISELLRVVTEELDSWCALIWMATPGSDPALGHGRLFVLGYWVPDPKIRVWHELNFQSMAGSVLRENKTDRASLGDDRIAKPTPKFLQESKATQLCLAPMEMADGSAAVLEVYRVHNRPFSDEEMERLDQMAAILPALYATLADRVGFKLQEEISQIRRMADWGGTLTPKKAVARILAEIQSVFRSLEVSVFLQDDDGEDRDLFPLYEYIVQWDGPWTEKSSYRPGEGITGHVIKNGRAVRLVDLAHYADDADWIAREYSGLEWSNSLQIVARARKYHNVNDPEAAPPVSFLCAPIGSGKRVYGAIRCCGSIESPFYFDEWQVRLLQAVAARIAAWWQGILRERQKDEDLKAWERLVAGFDSMNHLVQRSLTKRESDESELLREAMRHTHEVIPLTDNSDIRMVEGDSLVTKAVYGRDWERFAWAKTKRWSLNPPDCAAAELVVNKGPVAVYDDINMAPRLSRIFGESTKKLVLVPITVEERTVGVLCIRSNSPRPFPPYTKLIAGLIGQQLGLYNSLAAQIRNLQAAEAHNKKMIETQARTIGDVHHQVKSPILSAYRTAQRLSRDTQMPKAWRAELERLRSLSSKVNRVVRNMRVFSDLSLDKTIQIKRQLLEREKLSQMLSEACADQNATLDPDKQLGFEFDPRSLADLAGKDRVGKFVEADIPLIEQCVANLLDNAAKYSFPRTAVVVSGGAQAKGEEYFVSVANRGFKVAPEQVSMLTKRGYRADQAIWSAGEGSGIGLWIVDKIMKAHGGRLSINPTNKNGITEVRLVFPIKKGIESLAATSEYITSRR